MKFDRYSGRKVNTKSHGVCKILGSYKDSRGVLKFMVIVETGIRKGDTTIVRSRDSVLL